MDRIDVASSLVRVASDMTADERLTLETLPGMSEMQLSQLADRLQEAADSIQEMRRTIAPMLNAIKGKEDFMSEAKSQIESAAKQMGEKGKFAIQARKAIVEFTLSMESKVPGIRQMLADPETAKTGEKAGDFFGRIAAKHSKKIADSVRLIYNQTVEDLTHIETVMRGFKVMAKSSTVTASEKIAGLSDFIIAFKNWLEGGSPEPIFSKITKITHDIKRFVRGFLERTGIVKKATKDLEFELDSITRESDKLLSDYLAQALA